MASQSNLWRAAMAPLAAALAGSAGYAQTFAPPPAPLPQTAPIAISPETAALAKCMETRNPDAFAARRQANSQSARHPDGRRIAAAVSIAMLGCEAQLGTGAAKADIIQAIRTATVTLANGAAATPAPPRAMAGLAGCLVAKHPTAARRFVDAAEAAAAQAATPGTLSFAVDAALVTKLLSGTSCGALLTAVGDRVESSQLYAEVLRQLPGPGTTVFAAHPVAETGLKIASEPAGSPLRPLAACLWQQNRNRALIITDDYSAARGASTFQVRLGRRTEFAACGGEPAVELAVANAPMLASLLFLIRQNQFVRCVIARDRAGLLAALDGLKADGVPRLATLGTPTGDPRWLAIVNKPFASPVLDTMESCDVAVSDAVKADGIARQGLLVEIDHELARDKPPA